MISEDIKLYLPQYLSADSKNALLDALKDFPEVPIEKFYTTKLADTAHIYQGDGILDLVLIDLPNADKKSIKAIILSNTCDIAPENESFFPKRMMYTPIIELKTYEEILSNDGIEKEQLRGHIESIKKQWITQIFYLPGIDGVIGESIVFFDRVLNIDIDFIGEQLKQKRLFSLGNYGHYLLLFKLSFHFCRFQDRVDRDG